MKNLMLSFVMLAASSLATAQTTMTSKIVNPSFEQDVTNGWVCSGMQRQSNNAFTKKSGTYYMEKWTGKGGKVGNASLQQTVTGLPAGRYTVTCAAQNIQEDTPSTVQTGVWVMADGNKTAVNVTNDYSVSATVIDGTLDISYVLDGATGNYVTVDNFRLVRERETASIYNEMHTMMQQVVDEANAIDKHLDTKEQAELDAARAALAALIDKNTADGVTEAVSRLLEAIYQYRLATASESASIDMTSHITNPNFELNGVNGWDNQGMAVQSNNAFTKKVGATYMEAWTGKSNKIGDVTLSQSISLPNGNYILTAAAQNMQENNPTRVMTGAYLFAGDAQTEVGLANTYSVKFTVTEGKVTIGFKTRSATGNWVAVDNFTLKYTGRSDAGLLDALASIVKEAKAIADRHMNASVKNDLEAAIKTAEAMTSIDGMEKVASDLRKAMEAAEASADAYQALLNATNEANAIYGSKGDNGLDKLKIAIDDAQATYADMAKSNGALAAAVKALNDAVFNYQIANATGEAPQVTTSEYIARGATGALGRSTVKGSGIKERGFCWATHKEPTIFDSRTTDYYDINGPMYIMRDLAPATVYYVRAYAISNGNAVGYGEVRKVITLPMGTCTWWYNNGGSADENARINFAIEDCINYYNNWSSIQGFHITCSYGAGTPTADCSYGGSMRVGPNPSYQRTGTLLHESNHGVGVGTQERWWDTNLHEGKWKGERANKVLQFIENNPTATMSGDNMHMWPYGINGANEDSGWPMLYIANVLITQGLHEDGLAPISGGGCTPAYTFESDDDVKYYIASEKTAGAYLCDNGSTSVTWQTRTSADLAADDSYAWYVQFVPAKGYYRLRNAKTGKYLTYAGGSIRLASKANPSDTEYFQMMGSRQNLDFGMFRTKGYWVLSGNNVLWPYAMTVGANSAVSTSTFNISDAATAQRWIFLTAEDASAMDNGVVDAEKVRVNTLLDGAKKLLAVPHKQLAQRTDATFGELIDVCEQTTKSAATVEEVADAYSGLWSAIGNFLTYTCVSSESAPYDVTFMMQNPALDGIDGWNFTNKAPTYSEGISEYYQTTFNVSQTIPDMAAARYVLHADAFERPGSYADANSDWTAGRNKVTANLYYGNGTVKQLINHIMAGGQKSKVGTGAEQKPGDLYIPDNMAAAGAYFTKGYYDNAFAFTHTTAGNLTVGIRNSSSVDRDWTAFDNFHLYCLGNEGEAVEDPTDEPVVDPDDPTDEPVVDPEDPTDEPVVDPEDPTDEPVVDPEDPTDEPVVDPEDPTDEPTEDPEITSISSLPSDFTAAGLVIHDLTGRRLTAVRAPGIYIVNGRKVMLK